MGNHSNVLERGRLFCSGYTQGEMAIKMPRCIAIYAGKTIELQAEALSPPKRTAVGHQRAYCAPLSTARKIPTGGTGIRSTVTGQTLAMDILGKWLATCGVCFAILPIDEASGFAEVYGINNKNDLLP
jgi:hypothetical protein